MAKKSTKAGSFYIFGIGFFVALAGAVFMYIMWQSYRQASLTRTWDKTEAVMIVSDFETRSAEFISKEYRWQLEYIYSYEGEDYSSTFYEPRETKWTSRKPEVQDLISKYSVNASVFCYVNPEKPSQAILSHDSKAAGYSIWFPGLFVLGGGGIMLGALIGMKPC